MTRLNGAHISAIGWATYCPRAPHPALITRRRASSRQPSRNPACRGTPFRPVALSDTVPDESIVHHTQSPVLRGQHLNNSLSPSPRPRRSIPRRMPKHPPSLLPVSGAVAMHPPQSILRASRDNSSRRALSLQSSKSSISSDEDSPLSTPQHVATLLPPVTTTSSGADVAGFGDDPTFTELLASVWAWSSDTESAKDLRSAFTSPQPMFSHDTSISL